MSHNQQKLGALFTNATHNIIFMDSKLCKSLGYSLSQLTSLIHKPVQTILNMSNHEYSVLVNNLQNHHELPDQSLTLKNEAGKALPVTANIFANQDVHFGLVGIDYTFYPTDATQGISVTSTQEFIVTETVHDYFKKQVSVMFTIMEQWNGETIARHLNKLTNQSAQRQGWDIKAEGKDIHIGQSVSTDMLLGILKLSASYSVKVLGKDLIMPELKAINNNTPDVVFESIDNQWFMKI